MKIYSDTGYLIVMDPAYLKMADQQQIKRIDFLETPEQAAQKLEQLLFPEGYGGLIGLVPLSQGPGRYDVNLTMVNFWDVESQGRKIIFGVDEGSFIIFDIKHIQPLVEHFDEFAFDRSDRAAYFQRLQRQFAQRDDIVIWSRSPLPFEEGWHEIDLAAFKKID
ncbi:MAG: hypothetical protein ONB32_04865 [candidate division KSB1 bacterium]|nr:hypothetical protein [candidate division KSB1 bacterium]